VGCSDGLIVFFLGKKIINYMAKVVILSGAGLSAESHIDTFRDSGGLWEAYDVKKVAHKGALENNRAQTLEFYDKRRTQLKDKKPNKAHKVLAQLKKSYKDDIAIITQNVDDLFEKAGLIKDAEVTHLHGFLTDVRCEKCSFVYDIRYDAIGQDRFDGKCPTCRAKKIRPDIVMFGENAPNYDVLNRELKDCKLLVVIGTSGNVIDVSSIAKNIDSSILNNLESNEAIDASLFSNVLYKKVTEAIDEIKEEVESYLQKEVRLKEHYVYELIDPRSNEVFYVGKGVERRVQQHQKDSENDNSTKKLKRIKDIELDNQDVIERIIGRYDTDYEAKAVEATLIKYIYGLENLTNEVHGRGANTIREKGNINTIEGVDIPETKYEHSYEYTNENKLDYEKYRVQDFMEDTKTKLEQISTLDFSSPEPQLAYKSVVIKHIIKPFEIHVLTNSNESKGLVVEVKPAAKGRLGREDITKLINGTTLEGIGKRSDNTYTHAKIPNTKMTVDIDVVVENINQYVEIINKFLDENNK